MENVGVREEGVLDRSVSVGKGCCCERGVGVGGERGVVGKTGLIKGVGFGLDIFIR